MRPRMLVYVCLLVLLWAGALPAQQRSMAQPGALNYVEGTVAIGGTVITQKDARTLTEGERLATKDGHAEVIVAPGTVLRLDASSEIVMTRLRLLDMRIEVVRGSVMLECMDLPKHANIALTAHSASLVIMKKGLYRLDSDARRVRVYDGEAELRPAADALVKLKKGDEVLLEGAPAKRFNTKELDELAKWSSVRADYVALASQHTVRILVDSGYYWPMSGWYWNPYMAAYGFVPYGRVTSYYGHQYYAPREYYGSGSYGVGQPPPAQGGGSVQPAQPGRGGQNPPPGVVRPMPPRSREGDDPSRRNPAPGPPPTMQPPAPPPSAAPPMRSADPAPGRGGGEGIPRQTERGKQ